MEYYYNENGDLGVLYSPGFGAGWGSWNTRDIALDKRIVEYFINESPSADDMADFLDSLGYDNVYMGGYHTLKVGWVPRGTWFCIHEYDGAECIATPDGMGMMKA